MRVVLLLLLAEAKHELIDVQMDMDRQTSNAIIQQERLEKIMEENVKLKKSNKQFEDDLDETRERLTDSMLVASQLTAEVRRQRERGRGREREGIRVTMFD